MKTRKKTLLMYGLIVNARCPGCGQTVKVEHEFGKDLSESIQRAGINHQQDDCVPWLRRRAESR